MASLLMLGLPAACATFDAPVRVFRWHEEFVLHV